MADESQTGQKRNPPNTSFWEWFWPWALGMLYITALCIGLTLLVAFFIFCVRWAWVLGGAS